MVLIGKSIPVTSELMGLGMKAEVVYLAVSMIFTVVQGHGTINQFRAT